MSGARSLPGTQVDLLAVEQVDDDPAAGFKRFSENALLEMFVLAARPGMHRVSFGLYSGWNTTAGSQEDFNRLGAYAVEEPTAEQRAACVISTSARA